MIVRFVIASVFITGCSTRAFTPPARPMPLSPAQTPKTGEYDVQVDGNANGAVFGPTLYTGNLRYRHGLSDQLSIVGDVGYARAEGHTADHLDPNAGTARVGGQLSAPAIDEIDAAVFAGVGGGYAPAAGGWGSVDVGGTLTGTHRYVRPMLVVNGYVSEPFATKVFTVTSEMLRLPRTFGAQGLVGLDLGPRDRAVLIGLAAAFLHGIATDVHEAEQDVFIGLGGGFRFGN